ncbi:MAG TPA: divalent metal cation transporter [Pyrinomonadaceae bacterium]|nr:divalent metal cation transporter [Pyrinomonadaceae bacterium]
MVQSNDQPAKSPREALESRIEQEKNPLKRLFMFLGPGLITGASDDDPSGIGTYTTAGASLGLATLWTALVTLPMMAAVQFVCAKIGMVTGMGLAGVLRKYYPRWLVIGSIVLLLVANTINAGTDIGAIAAAINLLTPRVPALALVAPIAIVIVVVQILGSYGLIVKIFKWLTLTLFAYIAAAFLAKPDWAEVMKATIVPTIRFDNQYLMTIVAIFGTTITPYLFFWQASQEVEEELRMGRATLAEREGATDRELKIAEIDVDAGMFFASVVFYFVVLASAVTLHASGKTDIQTATDAAQALRPLSHGVATILFALGLIGSGFLAVPILTGSSAYAMCEAFDWKYGLDEKFRDARRFYLIIAAATVIGLLISFLKIPPVTALFWTAVINGVLAPPLIVVIMLVSNNKKIMGKRTNGRLTNILGWSTAAIMTAAAVGMLVTWGK